jgi:hypothetical protein
MKRVPFSRSNLRLPHDDVHYAVDKVLVTFGVSPITNTRISGTLPLFRQPKLPVQLALDITPSLSPHTDAPGFLKHAVMHEQVDHLLGALRQSRKLHYAIPDEQDCPTQRSTAKLDEARRFVMFRKTLRQLLSVPVELSRPWSARIHRIGKTLFMQSHVHDWVNEVRNTGRFADHHHGGMLFEKICCGLDLHDSTHDVFCSAASVSFCDWKGIVAAEIDSCDESGQYREVKTAPALEAQSPEGMSRRFYQIWLQSYLAGVPKVTVGYRSLQNPAVIDNIHTYNVDDIPRLCSRSWHPSAVLALGRNLLDQLWNCTSAGGQYRVIYDPHVDDEALVVIEYPQATPTFLPAWFTRRYSSQ